jgi:hypothetical protein
MAILACAIAPRAQAQQPRAAQVQPSPVPVPGALELNKLVWSTMAAIDHANLAGNSSVLRDLSAPNFQILNDSAKLASIFASLRASGIDLSNALLLTPTFTAQAKLPQRDVPCFLLRLASNQRVLIGVLVADIDCPLSMGTPNACHSQR